MTTSTPSTRTSAKPALAIELSFFLLSFFSSFFLSLPSASFVDKVSRHSGNWLHSSAENRLRQNVCDVTLHMGITVYSHLAPEQKKTWDRVHESLLS